MSFNVDQPKTFLKEEIPGNKGNLPYIHSAIDMRKVSMHLCNMYLVYFTQEHPKYIRLLCPHNGSAV